MTRVNSTEAYYRSGDASLGWELTVSNALYPEDSPCRKVLATPASYGHLLYNYLSRFIPMDTVRRVLEIGGGYGYVMKDFLTRNPALRATLVDISPRLSAVQRQTLKDYPVDCVIADVMELDPSALAHKDLAILNENLGDLPTLVDASRTIFEKPAHDPTERRVRELFSRYDFEIPDTETFSFNLGAVEAVEKLCASGIPYLFMGEHSCEAHVPEPIQSLVSVSSCSQPERISLKGHDEYTLQFSHLEQVAAYHRYSRRRGPFADFLEIQWNDRLRRLMASPSLADGESEILRHFVEDLYKYEYLILMSNK
ncbi:MAG: class I SAM-dependent methyltransferase [Desulfobacterota bacterium]|jgi:SAM-dependent methyltransferase|nr:class I SAM-dependent methyltransferase [Thermodesulfobacteriota bacterium]